MWIGESKASRKSPPGLGEVSTDDEITKGTKSKVASETPAHVQYSKRIYHVIQRARKQNRVLADLLLENVSKKFGEVEAVKQVNLHAEDKEFLTLLGPSGCGKTTTMRLVAGLESPTTGRIYIGGTIVNNLSPKERDIAMVFQNYALYPHMKVRDNIAFPLKMRKYSAQSIEDKVKATAALLKIEHLLDRRPAKLSGGEQQRVALGRALVREPKLFLLDEPLSNLDAKLRVHMRSELKSLHRRIGITTIYVTHDQVEAMAMSDRIAIMNAGEIQQLGTPEQIYGKPNNTFVAGFIGSVPMNFFKCTYVKADGRAMLKMDRFAIEVKDYQTILESSGSAQFTLGVRPEDIEIERERTLNDSIAADVEVVEPLGAEIIITLRVGGETIKVRSTSVTWTRPGEKAFLNFKKDKIHIYDEHDKALV